MRTPFDTAQRVQHRAVETVRVAISVEVERHSRIESESDALVESIARERAMGHAAGWISTDAWLARMRAERARLQNEARSAEARLAALRAQAAEAYGAMRVIDGAVDRHQEEALRIEEVSEQGRLDDMAAARLMRSKAAR
ncbi:MAG: hypothetical protein WCS75_05925 [Sphingomonas sp.]|jgi:flagellar biosynthesis chaperone FliJ|uniref:hypothetical protein n=1 Tax=Sphingomonas sp. TaxID=28214 RepID=UPI00356809F1